MRPSFDFAEPCVGAPIGRPTSPEECRAPTRVHPAAFREAEPGHVAQYSPAAWRILGDLRLDGSFREGHGRTEERYPPLLRDRDRGRLPRDRPSRERRHGNSAARARRDPGPPGRHQVRSRRASRQRFSTAIHRRGEGDGAREPPERTPNLRVRRAPRRTILRDGVHRGCDAGGVARQCPKAAAARYGSTNLRRYLQGSVCDSRHRRPSPRSQAEQHPPRCPATTASRRSRPRHSFAARRDPESGAGGHAGVHGSRDRHGRDGSCASRSGRRIFTGVHRLRALCGKAAVFFRHQLGTFAPARERCRAPLEQRWGRLAPRTLRCRVARPRRTPHSEPPPRRLCGGRWWPGAAETGSRSGS
jgi:hypothetical protein